MQLSMIIQYTTTDRTNLRIVSLHKKEETLTFNASYFNKK